MSSTITIAYGDGVGPEIMEAALLLLREAGAELEIEAVELGQRVYNMEGLTGILPSSWERIRRSRALLKGPTNPPTETDYTGVTEALKISLGLEEIPLHETHFGEHRFQVRELRNQEFSLFEPVQEPLTNIAGKNIANPSAMILASVKLLETIGQEDAAETIKKAWRATLEAGLHPRDMYQKTVSKKKLRARAFTEAIIERLGKSAA